MLNRRSSVYYTLPDELVSGTKTKESKATISIGIVVPKDMEKKAQKFMEEATDDFAKSFKKFMKKQVEKRMED